MLVHGTADRMQPWGGRRAISRRMPAYVPVPATVDAWVAADRARPAGTSELAAVPGPGAAGAAQLSWWAAGPGGAPVVAYRVLGLDHRWPVATAGAVRPGTQLSPVDATALVVRTAAHGVPARV